MIKELSIEVAGRFGGTYIKLTLDNKDLTYYRCPWGATELAIPIEVRSKDKDEKPIFTFLDKGKDFEEEKIKFERETGGQMLRANPPEQVAKYYPTTKIITPDESAWSAFENAVSKLSPEQWAPEYRNKGIPDGIWWEFTVVTDKWTLKSSGINAFPLEGQIDDATLYIAFIRATEALIGQKLN
jgi:hypothetical protein